MKKNIAMRVASLVLMCTIVTSCFVSSTFAKYTSSASGSDTVTVAKWAFKVGDDDITKTNTVSFDLFSTITEVGGGAETDVNKDSDGNLMLAPGTQGGFSFTLENTSDVTAEYAITFNVEGGDDIPFEYSTDGTNWVTTLANVSTTKVAIGGTATPKVYWRWPYDKTQALSGYTGTDAGDTAIGIAAQTAATVEVTATITATQVD